MGVSHLRLQSYNNYFKSANRLNHLNISILDFWHTFCCFLTLAYNSALPAIFALDLLEDRDVADGGKMENARPDFDCITAKNVVN